MQTYDCHVRLANTTSSEVPKNGVTAPEIIILRKLHGLDSVVRIQVRRMDNRTHASERSRLQKLYGDIHPGLIENLFGHDHIALPVSLNADVEKEAAAAVAAKEIEEAEKAATKKAEFEASVEAEVQKRLGELAAVKAHAASNQADTGAKTKGTLSLKA